MLAVRVEGIEVTQGPQQIVVVQAVSDKEEGIGIKEQLYRLAKGTARVVFLAEIPTLVVAFAGDDRAWVVEPAVAMEDGVLVSPDLGQCEEGELLVVVSILRKASQ